jgi:hypothetical protein
MSTALEAAWSDVITNLTGPASIAALVNVLDRHGDLDTVKDGAVASAGDELRADVNARVTQGQLGQAVALIEAGAAKDVVIAKVSRRTYYRARRECQLCQHTPSGSSV